MKPLRLEVAHPAQPQTTPVDELLAHDDATLGAQVVSVLCAKDPTGDNFAALGRMVRAGARADLEAVVRRKGRR